MEQQFSETDITSIESDSKTSVSIQKLDVQTDGERIEDLLEALGRPESSREKRFRIIGQGMASGGFAGLLHLPAIHGRYFAVASVIAFVLSIGTYMMIACIAGRGRRKRAKQLAQYDDKRAVGPLIEALWYEDRATPAAATAALTRLLPQLRASEAAVSAEEFLLPATPGLDNPADPLLRPL